MFKQEHQQAEWLLLHVDQPSCFVEFVRRRISFKHSEPDHASARIFHR